jgi:GNAT superfamily N-acetyltransferase
MGAVAVKQLSGGSSHLNRAARWLNETWGESLGFSLGETLDWCLDVAATEHQAMFGALNGGSLLGCALLVETDLETEPDLTPWLSGLYVAPQYRGNQIGAMLISQVETAAREIGHHYVYLFCPTGQLVSYYDSFGWDVRKPITVDDEPFAVMSKYLGR